MAMRIEQGDITKLAVDAIVNAANQVMLAGHPDLEVVFCCFSKRDAEVYESLLIGHDGI